MESKGIRDLPGDISQVKEQVVKKIDDKPIGMRLKGSYVLMVAVTVIISVIALATNLDASYRLKSFKAAELEIIDQAWSARQHLSETESQIYQMFLSGGSELEAGVSQAQENAEALKGMLSRMNSLARKAGKEDEKLVAQAQAAMDKLIPIQQQVMEYARQSKPEEGMRIVAEEGLPVIKEIEACLTQLCDQAKKGANDYVTYSYIRIGILAALLVAITLFAVIKSLKISRRIVGGITGPLAEVERALDELAEGKLDFCLEYKADNEIGHLAHTTRNMAAEFKKYIMSLDEALGKMAGKDFTAQINMEYKGDFQNMKTSFEKIAQVMNDITATIRNVAEDVSHGSGEIADVSQNLADGASDQSGAVEELLATIQEISQQVDHTAKNVGTVSSKSEQAQAIINKGNERMEELMGAMQEITEASRQISEIITVINGISSQTNMLALNASIEAARAGEQGKGFAVVADEIGQLAGETNKATQNTRELIQRSLDTVKKGVELANETAESLKGIVVSADQIKELANEVSEASSRQAQALGEINKTVQMVADVAQTNAAVAEEASASSNELTSHAKRLADSLQEFKLAE